MQPLEGATPRPPGEPASVPSAAGEQQSAEVWAGLKQDLGLKNDTPLLSRHFPAAEQNLNQRLTSSAPTTLATCQIIQQLSDLLPQDNNHQALSGTSVRSSRD